MLYNKPNHRSGTGMDTKQKLTNAGSAAEYKRGLNRGDGALGTALGKARSAALGVRAGPSDLEGKP